MAHVTPSDVVDFRARTLDRARVEAIGAHVRECDDCARLVFGDPGIAESAQAVWTPEQRPRRRWRAFAWAAAAVFVVAVIAIWITRDQPQTPQPPRPDDPQRLAYTIHDGSVAITIAREGLSGISTSRPAWNALAATALRDGRLPAAEHADLVRPGEVLRGNGDDAPSVELLEPVAVVVESDRPVFRWTSAGGARYRVVVARNSEMAVRSEMQSGTVWQPAQPLRRGETYAWQLAVVTGEREWTIPPPHAPQARFRILSEEAVRELEAARATRSRLLTGLVAARLGLRELAERELSAFAAEHPEVPGAAKLAAAARTGQRPAPTTTNADQ